MKKIVFAAIMVVTMLFSLNTYAIRAVDVRAGLDEVKNIENAQKTLNCMQRDISFERGALWLYYSNEGCRCDEQCSKVLATEGVQDFLKKAHDSLESLKNTIEVKPDAKKNSP